MGITPLKEARRPQMSERGVAVPVGRRPAGGLMVQEGAAFCWTHCPDLLTSSPSGCLRPAEPHVGSVHAVLLPARS